MMPFGKYRDQPFEDIPDSYLRWLLEQPWIFPDLRDEVETYLAGKRVQQAAETAKKKKTARKRKKRYTPEEIHEYGNENLVAAAIILANKEHYGPESLMVRWALMIRDGYIKTSQGWRLVA